MVFFAFKLCLYCICINLFQTLLYHYWRIRRVSVSRRVQLLMNSIVYVIFRVKAKISYASFPVTCVCCVVSFSKFHYNDATDLLPLPTCCGLVSDTANYLDMSRYIVRRVAIKSITIWQLPRQRGSYGETCLGGFGA